MISSRRLPMWKRLHYWFPALWFLLLWAHGATLGLTDDEAYYWVLAQKPALGYAFHPPAVAWSIAIPQALLSWLFGTHSPALVRLPACLYSALILGMGLFWLDRAGTHRAKGSCAAVLLSFAGLFGTSWMMVPDLPLLCGWMLAFIACWELCFGSAALQTKARPKRGWLIALGAGVALAILSKYSGILVAFSAAITLFIWANAQARRQGLRVIGLGVFLAAIPILIWNSQHEWASILYQFRDRHGDAHFSGLRYLRFWFFEILLAGAPLVLYSFSILFKTYQRRSSDSVQTPRKVILVWLAPGAIAFCLQPLWADFKPHWAFVVWWPAILLLALEALDYKKLRAWSFSKWQIGYGLPVLALGLLVCRFPLISEAVSLTGRVPDPRWDISNDMFGWEEAAQYLEEQGLTGDSPKNSVAVVGSRYQTASQIAFALGKPSQVTLLPRDLKQRDEWPELGVTPSPDSLDLRKSVIYIADNRYSAPPEFKGATCSKLTHLEVRRWDFLAKTFDIYECNVESLGD